MQKKTNITDEIYSYVLKYGVKEHSILKELREYTNILNTKNIQIQLEVGQLMALLAKMINAKHYLEIGVFMGYSSLNMALAMGDNSIIYALDNNQQHLDIAAKFWAKASVSDRIKPVYGQAIESLEKLLAENKINYFDIAFIDANKKSYKEYYEYCYSLVRPGGLVLIDNVLFYGEILEQHPAGFVKAIKDFNQFIYNDSRVDISLLPIADGLTIAYKKETS